MLGKHSITELQVQLPDPTSSGQSHEVSHAVPKSSLCSQGGPVFGFNFIEENWGVGVQAYNPNAQEAEA